MTPSARYGYVGEHGYQAHSEISFLHLGARYYDPGLGRFLQRDPIGIDGGSNVYAYSENGPTLGVDPAGEYTHKSFHLSNTGRLRYGPSKVLGNPGVRTWALRCGNTGLHLRGVYGAVAVGGAVAGSGAAGIVAGRAIDNAVGENNNGFRISDGLADILYRTFVDDGSGYDPWG